uniref:Uncharacterized protein n=1 Tax=Arundo donax TaxID=35708 RepID=A0A0A9BEJ5_ARUDO
MLYNSSLRHCPPCSIGNGQLMYIHVSKLLCKIF